jgi:hypothetical protein
MQSARLVFALLMLEAGAPVFARGGGVTGTEEKPGLLSPS